MFAEVIAVGSEMLGPVRLDTNSLVITRRLNELGIRVRAKCVVGDRPEDLELALRTGVSRSRILFFTGGLGPTNDDLTREVVARALGRRLHLNEALLEQLTRRFARLAFPMPENNRRQALVPEDAEVLPNRVGSAPGLMLEEEGVLIFLLPGPPRELETMLDEEVVPRVRARLKTGRQYLRRLRVGSLPESRVDALTQEIYKSYPEVETTILSSAGIIDLHFLWIGPDEDDRAVALLTELIARVREVLGEAVFTEEEEELAEVVLRLLRKRGATLATAESCTGGWIGKLLTDVPGSSAAYRGGVVCYHDDLKSELLGVPRGDLESHGAVSETVARRMAEGVRRLASVDYGISVTGVAGPGGGTAEKPVGLVYVGIAAPEAIEVKELRMTGDRESVRLRSSRMALDLLRRKLF